MTSLAVEIPEAFGFLFDPPLGGARYRVAYGGRGSAKSWQFGRALLILGARSPLRILCAREFQASIKDSVHRLLSDQIEKLGLGWCYTVQQTGIFGSNGTEFLFKGLRRDVNEVKSTEGVDVCWIEEAEAVSDTSWKVLIPTIRKPDSEIWVSFNPAEPTDPTYQRFVADPPARALVHRVGYRDNPWLPDVLAEEARELKRRDPEAYAHVWGGDPLTRSDAQVFAGRYVIDEFEPQAGWQGPYYGADWGFARDPAVLVRMWIGDGRLWIEYSEGGIGLTLDDLERSWSRIPDAKRYVIRADSARPETIAEMVRRGWRVEAAPKWSGSVEDGIEHLRSYDQIVVHPRCRRTAEEMRLYRYKVDKRTGDVLPQLVDAHNHDIDAIRYALAPLIRQRDFRTVTVSY